MTAAAYTKSLHPFETFDDPFEDPYKDPNDRTHVVSGRLADEIAGAGETSYGGNSDFHHLEDLPREIREKIWEYAVLRESRRRPELPSTGFAFRCTSRAVADESRRAFFKHAICYLHQWNPLYKRVSDTLDNDLVTNIQNLDICLTYRLRGISYSRERIRIYGGWRITLDGDFLCGCFEMFKSQGLSRNVCFLNAESTSDMYSSEVVEDLKNMRDFKTIIFNGYWFDTGPNDSEDLNPDDTLLSQHPFQDFV